MNHNMVCNLAGGGRKFEICLEMCSPGPKDTSKSPECHYSMHEFDFIEISKILFFTNFTCIWPFWWKLSKIVIFWCLKKYHLDIKRLHPRYSEVSLGPGEHISRHISNFGPPPAKFQTILWFTKFGKNHEFWPKIRFSSKWPILSGKSIYGRRLTFGVF